MTVTIGARVLTARAVNGAWTVSADTLTAGEHPVTAAVVDPSGNRGTASQLLTVDTSLPIVAISGGATKDTNETTPTISGTTDQPLASVVTVTVGGQTLTAAADAAGAWSVTADALTETAQLVRASVTDDSRSVGSSNQVLTVDVTLPVLTIDGGPSRSTVDTSPWIYGTTAEKAGTIVQVTLGGQSLAATVQSGGTWGVSAQAVASGTYFVLATITDAAGNRGFMGQTPQIGSEVTAPEGPTPSGGADVGTTHPHPRSRARPTCPEAPWSPSPSATRR